MYVPRLLLAALTILGPWFAGRAAAFDRASAERLCRQCPASRDADVRRSWAARLNGCKGDSRPAGAFDGRRLERGTSNRAAAAVEAVPGVGMIWRVFRRICAALMIAAISILSASPVWACYAIVAGRDASRDGAVLVAHAEQNAGRRIVNFRRAARQRHDPGAEAVLRRRGRLPEVRETWAFLWSEIPEREFSDNYLNEWGVAAVGDYCPSREGGYAASVRGGEIREGGVGYMLARLIAQKGAIGAKAWCWRAS